ncbi:MAG: 50S ribosomal protein L37ae [archaeon]|nr:50S ribosomal protein L37ae [archaeon]
MSKGTEKSGVAGRFGARYGVIARNRTKVIETSQRRNHECPVCHHAAVRRMSLGVWGCRRCGAKYTAGAYSPDVREIVTKIE